MPMDLAMVLLMITSIILQILQIRKDDTDD